MYSTGNYIQYLVINYNGNEFLKEFGCIYIYSPWTTRRSNQSILKETNPEYLLEGLMLKLKLQYFGHLMQRAYSLEKIQMLRKIEAQEMGQQRDEVVR